MLSAKNTQQQMSVQCLNTFRGYPINTGITIHFEEEGEE